VLQYHFNWKTITVAAAMTLWTFYFQIFDQAVAKEQVVELLANLVRQLGAPMLIVWDRLPGAPQPAGGRLRAASGGADRAGIPAGLCAGTESGGITVGALEASSIAQCLSEKSLAVERRRSS
jgi:hypothetical protein